MKSNKIVKYKNDYRCSGCDKPKAHHKAEKFMVFDKKEKEVQVLVCGQCVEKLSKLKLNNVRALVEVLK